MSPMQLLWSEAVRFGERFHKALQIYVEMREAREERPC